MFLTVHFETLTYRLNLLTTLLESTGLLRLKSDSLINFLLTKSIQHEGKGFENSQNDQQRECFDLLSNSLS